ncbi:4-alpha-glucanotransferase [Treponema parvum]|uniref:4-alpha-glucanotransferase n=1 Tax=Treponema parvum TaxID=138851 RepID=UPI001AEBC076|nr:4-alpha-glucanotransferase [Treponema parvum]QTQ15275.1 4-alpha-glucanotransferase [Treponema parvum]
MESAAGKKLQRLTGTVIPLGALRTEKSPVIGEFLSLIDLIPFCQKAELKIIQLLPVNDSGTHVSPYSALSAFALHPVYVSIPEIPEFSELYKSDKDFADDYDRFIKKHSKPASKKNNRYDYEAILENKITLLKGIFEKSEIAAGHVGSKRCSSDGSGLKTAASEYEDFSLWLKKNGWVKGYAVFKALKEKHLQASWKTWPEKDRKADAELLWNTEDVTRCKQQLFYAWVQFVCHVQFKKAADAVADAGILLKGDIPILMNEDSCDCWENGYVFDHGFRAGSPPDGDNPSGQNWGFPVYNWKQLKKRNYSWWKERLAFASQYYKAYRLDHILGFFRIWAVPEGDVSAELGHAEPFVPCTKDELERLGFDEGRIHWLSEPHIPTKVVEDITWNHESAHRILSTVANRIGSEELWNFKKELEGSKEIYSLDFSSLCAQDAEKRIKDELCKYWTDRCILQVKKDMFVPVWKYKDSTAWKSLNIDEREKLENLFEKKDAEQNGLWQSDASEILKELTSSVNMIPCGEDLGVSLECVPAVMNLCGILSLRVVRWCRNWVQEKQPFIPFEEYPPYSVTASSVHDSSTLRQWWETEKDSVEAFIKAFALNKDLDSDFSPETAYLILEKTAHSASFWCIHPLQDFLYLAKEYYLNESSDERINVPGTVTNANWVYRMPVSVEDLSKNKSLCDSIKRISEIHKDKGGQR